MKNLSRTLSLSLIGFLANLTLYSQATVLPSIGEVYNFSAGDSFLYKLTDISNSSPKVLMYVNRVVLSRDDSQYPDSLVYRIQEIFLDSNGLNPAVWDTIRIAYHNCNDTIFPYNGFMVCDGGPDSCGASSAVSIVTDTLFPGMTLYHAGFDCYFWNSGWNNAAEGLGIVHAYTACGDFVLYQYDIVMVHYYKAVTGINPLRKDFRFDLFPNPAANTVIINVDENLIGGTVSITDLTGRKIMKFELLEANLQLRISNFADGIYFMTVTKDTLSASRMLEISR